MAPARSLFVIYKKIKHTCALNSGPENTDSEGENVRKLVIKALKEHEPRNYLMLFFRSKESWRKVGVVPYFVGPVQASLSSR